MSSLLGREFRLDLLCAVRDGDCQDVAAASQRVVGGVFLEQTNEAGCSSLFKHALLRNAVDQLLIRRQRLQCHTRIAEMLASECDESVGHRPELPASHPSGAQRDLEAAQIWLAAGQAAMVCNAVVDAGEHLDRGLRDLEELDQDVVRCCRDLSISVLLAPAGALVTDPSTRVQAIPALRFTAPLDDALEDSEQALAAADVATFWSWFPTFSAAKVMVLPGLDALRKPIPLIRTPFTPLASRALCRCSGVLSLPCGNTGKAPMSIPKACMKPRDFCMAARWLRLARM